MAQDNDKPEKAEGGAPTGQAGSATTITSPPDDNKSGQKTPIPIAPIFTNQGRSNKTELERQKSAQQNYLIDLNQTLVRRKESIKRAQKYLANLEAAYSRAQSSGATEAARRLTGSISQTKTALGLQQKQKTLIEHYILDANKTLSEIHEKLAHAQNAHKPAGAAPNKQVSKGSVAVNVPEGTTVGVTSTVAGAQYAASGTLNQSKTKIKVKGVGKTTAGSMSPSTINVPTTHISEPTTQISESADTSTNRHKAKKLLGLGLASSVVGLFSKKPKEQVSVVFDQPSQSSTDTSQNANISYSQPSTAQPAESVKQGIGVTRWIASKAVGATAQVVEFTGKIMRYAGKGIQVVGRSIATTLGSIPYVGIPFKALGIGINGAGKGIEGIGRGIEGLGKSIGRIKQRLQILKSAKLLAAGTPVGAAIAIAMRYKQLKRLVAAAVAGLLYLLYLLWIKILGMMAGLAIGLVTGAPLLLIPGAGPFLYAGYNAYWVWRGWNDPVGTIQLATHPWELVTRPLNWAKEQLGNLGGATKGGIEGAAGGVGNAASGLISTASNFVTGLASSVWGGITGAAGGFLSTAGSIAGNFLGMLAGAGSSIMGNIIPVAVGGSMATLAGGTIAVSIFTNSAYYTPGLNPAEQIFPPDQNELFTITKTASETKIRNPEVLETIPVTFTVTVTAADTKLTNLKIQDDMTTSNGSTFSTSSNTCQQSSIAPGTVINPGGTWTCTIVAEINNSQSDAAVTNVATFTASTEDASITKNGSATTTIKVGTLNVTDPSGWPTCGQISQGPWTDPPQSHSDPNYRSSIDINNATGTKIYATHKGVITAATTDSNGGIYVAVRGTNYISFYVHLESIAAGVTLGTAIESGTLLGYMDTTGFAYLSHLHYMIRDIDNVEISETEFNGLVPGWSLYDNVSSSFGPC